MGFADEGQGESTWQEGGSRQVHRSPENSAGSAWLCANEQGPCQSPGKGC